MKTTVWMAAVLTKSTASTCGKVINFKRLGRKFEIV